MGSSPKSSKHSSLLGGVGGSTTCASRRKGQRRIGGSLLWLATAVAVIGILRLESMYKLTRLSVWMPHHRSSGAASIEAPTASNQQQELQQQELQQQHQQQQQQQQQHERPAIPPRALLLATHSRLMWYDPDTDNVLVLHEGEVRVSCIRYRQRAAGSRGVRTGPLPR